MPTNNILLFDQNKGNMMGDEAYSTNTQRLNGVQTGIASSQLQNKFQYQVSLVAYAIASLMYNNGFDANDANAVSAFVSNLSGTLVQKVLDKANTQEAQLGTVDTKWMSPALVKAAIDYNISSIMLHAYPVGSIYMSVNSTDPGTLFGGTWIRIQGRFLLAAGGDYAAGSTGGEATHVLTIDEMPAHTHNIGSASGTDMAAFPANRFVGNTSSITSSSTGGGAAHNNMPPYLAVYIWQRTA